MFFHFHASLRRISTRIIRVQYGIVRGKSGPARVQAGECMKVMKFGGTSVGSPEAVRRLIGIVKESGEKHVVVSAFSGVTDSLIKAARAAATGDASFKDVLTALRKRHRLMADTLTTGGYAMETESWLSETLGELGSMLLGISLVRELSVHSLDLIMSFGERMSAFIISRAFLSAGIEAEYADARSFLVTDASYGCAACRYDLTNPKVVEKLGAVDSLHVITGFISATETGETTTLGRGGSDLTASILGAALGAEEIVIWTDVDGIMTSDPRLVPEAFRIDEITYEEALELSHFGAKVLHPPTVAPAMACGIPIRIKNSFNPGCPGTLITTDAAPSEYPVRGIASIKKVALIRIEGSGMVGATGMAGRVLGCLSRIRANVILITQASSQHSICCAVSADDADRGNAELRSEFELEMMAGVIEQPRIERDVAIIAVVGERMKRRTGISGKVFHALGRYGVNIIAIAQGSSELNISAVINASDEAKALNAVHRAFFLSGIRSVNLFLVGTGLIGSTLLSQIAAQSEVLLSRHSVRINLVGITNSRRMLIKPDGIDPSVWKQALETGESADIRTFVAGMKKLNLPNTAFCDCTASDSLPELYQDILDSAIAIVTPNKRANAGPLGRYKALVSTSRETGIPYCYETTVGAGLPIIGPLQDLVASGDRITRIEAVLSGTISFILNSFVEGRRFSDLVREARERGYTEPDPRDDLSAMDAARKALILAREWGCDMHFEEMVIDPILPSACFEAPSVDAFFDVLASFDDEMERKRAEAAAAGGMLRYVAVIEDGKARLSLRVATEKDPFLNLVGTDNMVVFTTDRYNELPLVVKGPGAGSAVTAGGVFADVVKLAKTIV